MPRGKNYKKLSFEMFEAAVLSHKSIWLYIDKKVFHKNFVRLTKEAALVLAKPGHGEELEILVDDFDKDNLYIEGISVKELNEVS